MQDKNELANDIHDQVSDVVDDITVEEIEEEVEKFMEYGVQENELRRSVINVIADTHDIDRNVLYGGEGSREAEDVEIGDITEDGEYVNLEATVVELWDSNSDAVAQTGLIGDPTGRIKITTWSDNDQPQLEEGTSYRLENFLSDEYQGRLSVKGTQNSQITEVDEEIEVGDNEVTISGAMVDIQEQSGLVERCPEEGCTRVLQSQQCNEHGPVEDGEHDLRIKAVLDDGEHAYHVHINRELTEELTGITLDEAVDMATEAMDRTIVASKMREQLIGRYFTATGPELSDSLLAEEIEEDNERKSAQELLIEVRSL